MLIAAKIWQAGLDLQFAIEIVTPWWSHAPFQEHAARQSLIARCLLGVVDTSERVGFLF